MPGKRPTTLSQLIRSYGLQRIDNLVNAKKNPRRLGSNPMLDDLAAFYPRAKRDTLRSLVDVYKQSRKAARTGDLGLQKVLTPINSTQEKQWQYTTRIKVLVSKQSIEEEWMIPIISSRQLTAKQIEDEVKARVTHWKDNSIGRSKEKIKKQLKLVEHETILVTRKR